MNSETDTIDLLGGFEQVRVGRRDVWREGGEGGREGGREGGVEREGGRERE